MSQHFFFTKEQQTTFEIVCSPQRRISCKLTQRTYPHSIFATDPHMEDSDDNNQIVKVYLLDDNGTWQPDGVGMFSIEGDTVVIREEKRVVISSRILPDDVYRITDDIILVWSDPVLNREVALSFQSRTACQQAMRQVDEVRATMPCRPTMDAAGGIPMAQGGEITQLVNAGTIVEVHKRLKDAASSNLEEFVAYLSQNSSIITQFFIVFQELKNVGDHKGMELVVELVRITLMGCCLKPTQSVFVALLGSYTEVIATIYVLEHDREINPRGVPHMEHVQRRIDSLQPSERLPIDEDLLKRIKYVYALSYLRESVAPRVIEDETFVGGALPNHLNKLRHETYFKIFNDKEMMQRLVANLDEFSVGLIYEMISSMKTSFFPIPVREDYATCLLENGFLYAIGPMAYARGKVRGMVADLLYQVVCLVPESVRLYLASTEEAATQFPLLTLFLTRLLEETEESIAVVWKDILCVLLINPPPTYSGTDYSAFCSATFAPDNHVLDKIFHVVHEGFVSRAILGFLTFLAHHHWTHLGGMVESNRLLPRLVEGYICCARCPMPLRLATLDFLRNVCAHSSRFESELIIRDGLLRSIVNVIAAPRVSPMLTTAVCAVFFVMFSRRAFDALHDVAAAKSEQIAGVPALKAMFNNLDASPASRVRGDVEERADINESDFLSALEVELRTESKADVITDDGEVVAAPPVTLTPSLLSTIAGLCKKRSKDINTEGNIEEEETFGRSVKKR